MTGSGGSAPDPSGPLPFDAGRAVALTWIVVAVGLTVVLGPALGLRGWMWLGIHHLACAVGSGHELWRKRRRKPE